MSRCKERDSEWRGGFARPFQNIFLEGPVYTSSGDLYVVDIPYGRILRIDANKNVTVETEWDGEPNGLAVDPEGRIAIADYKQVYGQIDNSVRMKLIQISGYPDLQPFHWKSGRAVETQEPRAIQRPQRSRIR